MELTYICLENSLKAMEKNAEYGGQPEILALMHVTNYWCTTVVKDDVSTPLMRGNKSKELPKIMIVSITTNNANWEI